MHGAIVSLVGRSVQLMKRVQMEPEFTLLGGILRFETMVAVVREQLRPAGQRAARRPGAVHRGARRRAPRPAAPGRSAPRAEHGGRRWRRATPGAEPARPRRPRAALLRGGMGARASSAALAPTRALAEAGRRFMRRPRAARRWRSTSAGSSRADRSGATCRRLHRLPARDAARVQDDLHPQAQGDRR